MIPRTQVEALLIERVLPWRDDHPFGYLEGFRKREFTDTDLNKVLKTQELAQELIANDHN